VILCRVSDMGCLTRKFSRWQPETCCPKRELSQNGPACNPWQFVTAQRGSAYNATGPAISIASRPVEPGWRASRCFVQIVGFGKD
jgi:hypothetical protein